MYNGVKGGIFLDIQVNDKLMMKKKHPCGSDLFTVKRVGMDFKLVCDGCGHEIIIPRQKAEKSLKKIIKSGGET